MHKPDQIRTVGKTAPDFKLKDHTGKAVELSKFRGEKNVILVFYPRDETPGYTKQLCTIRDDFAQFKAADAVVFGINPQGAEPHSQFVEKFQFPFPLLIDGDKEVVAAYGCKGMLMTQRTVYGIDKEGKMLRLEGLHQMLRDVRENVETNGETSRPAIHNERLDLILHRIRRHQSSFNFPDDFSMLEMAFH